MATKYAYGTNPDVPLSTGCKAGAYCPNYGPPLDYLRPNADGALGGNPAFSTFIPKSNNPIVPPRPTESGWKDTAVVLPSEILTILARFEGFTDKFVFHSHMLEHEDNDMMRPYMVVP